jgi:hypothetical protein
LAYQNPATVANTSQFFISSITNTIISFKKSTILERMMWSAPIESKIISKEVEAAANDYHTTMKTTKTVGWLVAITWTISPKPAVQSVFSFGRAKSSSSSCSTDLIRPINEYQHEHLERKRIVATTTNPTTEGRAKKRRTKTRKTQQQQQQQRRRLLLIMGGYFLSLPL